MNRYLLFSFSLLVIVFSCNTFKEKQKKNFSIKITIENLPSDMDWVVFKSTNKGMLPFDFSTGELNPPKLQKLKIIDNVIEVSGYINEIGFYSLRNMYDTERFNFFLDVGDHILKTDYLTMKINNSYSYTPFECIKSNINDKYLEFWNSPYMLKYNKLNNQFIKWDRKIIKILYGIDAKEFYVLNETKTSRKKLLKSPDELKIYFKKKKEFLQEMDTILISGILDYIRKKPSCYIGLYHTYKHLCVYRSPKEMVDILGDQIYKFEGNIKKTSCYHHISNIYHAELTLQKGKPAPDFKAFEANGNQVSLSDFKGNYVLVEFWSSDCHYCKDERENLIDLYSKYIDEDIEFISISFDTIRKSWENSIDELSPPWLQLWDSLGYEKSHIFEKYSQATIPFYFLIDKSGNIMNKKIRGPKYALSKGENINTILENVFEKCEKTRNEFSD